MKKLSIAISTLALMTCFSSAFATMSVIDKSQGVISDPANDFVGKVTAAGYFNLNNELFAAIQVTDKKNNYVVISFNGADLTGGAAFINTVDKPLDVAFEDANFHILGLFTYNNNKNEQTLVNLQKKFLSK